MLLTGTLKLNFSKTNYRQYPSFFNETFEPKLC